MGVGGKARFLSRVKQDRMAGEGEAAVSIRSSILPPSSKTSRIEHPTHLDESLVVHVQELVKLDPPVLILLEGSGRLLGSSFLAGGKVGLEEKGQLRSIRQTGATRQGVRMDKGEGNPVNPMAEARTDSDMPRIDSTGKGSPKLTMLTVEVE